MIKVLGSLIVIFAGIGFGFHKAAKEQRRLEQGIAIKRMLYLLQGEIRYGFTPLPEAVLKISTKTEKEYQPFLKNVAKQLETHSEESFAKVWQQAAEYGRNDRIPGSADAGKNNPVNDRTAR